MRLPLAALWLLGLSLSGCDATGEGNGKGNTGGTTDADKDGYSPNGGDCDDYNAAISPAKVEVCDGKDNDCDGLTDDEDPSVSLEGAEIWYTDADGDGYGDGDAPVQACAQPDDAVTDSTDCDDSDEGRNPGAAEIVGDGTDEDCDLAEICYVDADGDGARGEETVESEDIDCADDGEATAEAPSGDDDSDAAIYPGAETVCGDDRVNDVAGSASNELEDCALGGDLGPSDAEAAPSGEASEGAGASVAGAGDVDGDGYQDLWVGAPTIGTTQGGAFLLSGPLAADADAGLKDMAAAWLKGASVDEGLGTSVDSAGDVNGDGYADGILGGPGTGVATLVLGPVTDTGSADTYADARLLGARPADRAGVSVCGLGDVNDDGVDDIAVGEDRLNYPTGTADNGGVWVISGPVAAGKQYLASIEALFLYGEVASDHAGGRVSAAGDFDGDGVGDLLVGAPGANGGLADSGAAYLLLGGISGTLALTDANLILRGEAASDTAGSALSGGADANGDGYADFAVGAPANADGGAGAGAVYGVFGESSFGSALDAASADVLIYGAAAGDALGTAVALDGDANGDGAGDLLLGAPGADEGETDGGAAYLFYTVSAGTLRVGRADATFTGDAADATLGSAVAFAGDTRGDGTLGVLVGASGQSTAYLFVGETW